MQAAPDGVTLALWVTPGARHTEIAGEADDRLRLRLAAPAHEGKANAELLRFLAATFGVRRRQITIKAGVTGRRKLVSVRGVTAEEARRALRPQKG